MSLINIVPRTEEYLSLNIAPISLRVVQDDGLKTNPDIDIKVVSLNKGQKHFLNNSGDGDKFKISILINKTDTFYGNKYFSDIFNENNFKISSDYFSKYDEEKEDWYVTKEFRVIDALDSWIRNMTILAVTSDEAVDITDGEYIITANPSREQYFLDGYSLWELEFTRYTPVSALKFNFSNKYVNKAKKRYARKKQKNAKSTVKSASVLNNKLKKCKVSQLKYSKTKKIVACVKTLQKYLNKKLGSKLKIDGWYGSETVKAVKKFQRKYKRKYNLTANGKMDTKTLNAMIKV